MKIFIYSFLCASIIFNSFSMLLGAIILHLVIYYNEYKFDTLNMILLILVALFLCLHIAPLIGPILIAEVKFLVVLFMGLLISNLKQNMAPLKVNSLIVIFIIIFSCIGIVASGKFMRFPDHIPIRWGFMSIYFGMFMLILLVHSRDIFLGTLCVIGLVLSGSGTVVVGFASFIVGSKSIKVGLKVALLLIAIAIFIVGQTARGRLGVDFYQIDRVVLTVGTLNYIAEYFQIRDYIFGQGLYSSLEGSYYASVDALSSSIGEYVKAEGNGQGSGRNFHNEFLRVLYHFGLIGFGLYLFILHKLCQSSGNMFIPLTLMSLFGPTITATPVFALLFFLRIR